MAAEVQHPHGTTAWFEMVGELLCDAASQGDLQGDTDWSLVERYTDGVALPGGLVQGLRLDIRSGTPSFRVGVRPDERGDVTIEISPAVARALNLLLSDDPAYAAALEGATRSGRMRVDGDLSRMAPWLSTVHDSIVARTSRQG